MQNNIFLPCVSIHRNKSSTNPVSSGLVEKPSPTQRIGWYWVKQLWSSDGGFVFFHSIRCHWCLSYQRTRRCFMQACGQRASLKTSWKKHARRVGRQCLGARSLARRSRMPCLTSIDAKRDSSVGMAAGYMARQRKAAVAAGCTTADTESNCTCHE